MQKNQKLPNLKNLVSALLMRPQGSQGLSKDAPGSTDIEFGGFVHAQGIKAVQEGGQKVA